MREQRFVFDEDAELYERARPGYPDALVDTVIELAALPADPKILEIGAGTGKATRAFAARGYPLVCLEPGERMAAVAKRELSAFAGLEFLATTFEEAELPPDHFDLVFSAQAFHWVAPEARYTKSSSLLREGGLLAILGNLPVPEEGELEEAIQRAYAEHAPSLVARLPGSGATRGIPLGEELSASPLFRDFGMHDFPWKMELDATTYVELVHTQSDHRLLPARERDALSRALAKTIDAHGGRVEVPYVARLLYAFCR